MPTQDYAYRPTNWIVSLLTSVSSIVCSLCTTWVRTTITTPTIIIQHNRAAALFVVLNIITPKKSCCFFAVGRFIIWFSCRVSYFSHTVRLLTWLYLCKCVSLYSTHTLWLIHFCGFIAIFMTFFYVAKSYISIMVSISFINPKNFNNKENRTWSHIRRIFKVLW